MRYCSLGSYAMTATTAANRFSARPTPENAVLLIVDPQPGLIVGAQDIDPMPVTPFMGQAAQQ